MQQLNLKIPTNLWRVLELHAQHTTQQPEQVVITPLPSTYKALTARYIKISISTALVDGVADGAVDGAELKT